MRTPKKSKTIETDSALPIENAEGTKGSKPHTNRTKKAGPISSDAAAKRHRKMTAAESSVSAPEQVPSATAPLRTIRHEDIALLAYSYWEARGCQGGSPHEDWIRAEQELRIRT